MLCRLRPRLRGICISERPCAAALLLSLPAKASPQRLSTSLRAALVVVEVLIDEAVKRSPLGAIVQLLRQRRQILGPFVRWNRSYGRAMTRDSVDYLQPARDKHRTRGGAKDNRGPRGLGRRTLTAQGACGSYRPHLAWRRFFAPLSPALSTNSVDNPGADLRPRNAKRAPRVALNRQTRFGLLHTRATRDCSRAYIRHRRRPQPIAELSTSPSVFRRAPANAWQLTHFARESIARHRSNSSLSESISACMRFALCKSCPISCQ